MSVPFAAAPAVTTPWFCPNCDVDVATPFCACCSPRHRERDTSIRNSEARPAERRGLSLFNLAVSGLAYRFAIFLITLYTT